ncbi:MAG: hypothetical protein FWD61_07235 [Phycisphaerales bacterium]|nr:hypothetical protein [Phycisphaerales bacterium]
MMRRFAGVMAVAVMVVGGGVVMGQTKPAMQEKPEKLSDPAADALQSYLYAQYTNDQASIKKLIEVTASKKSYADTLTSYWLWARYLERRAIEKWGKEDGMRVQGHVRAFDEQYAIDARRIRNAIVQYNAAKTAASVNFGIELNRPEGLQMGDTFNFLDTYEMVKVGGEWKLDFLKTYKRQGTDENEENDKAEMMAYPRMTKVLVDLCDQLKKGQLKTADDMKNIFDEKWSHVYDEPVRTVIKPGEKPPAKEEGGDAEPDK